MILDLNNRPQETFRAGHLRRRELRRDTDHMDYCVFWHSDIRLSGQQSALPRGGSAAVKESGAALFVCERSLLIPWLVNVNEGRCCRADVTGMNFWPLGRVGGKADIRTCLLSFSLRWQTNTNLCPDHITTYSLWKDREDAANRWRHRSRKATNVWWWEGYKNRHMVYFY